MFTFISGFIIFTFTISSFLGQFCFSSVSQIILEITLIATWVKIVPRKNVELDPYIKILTNHLDKNFYLFKKPFEIPKNIEYEYYNSISYR